MQRVLRNSLCAEGWKLFTGLYIAMPRERLRLYILSWMSLCKIFRKLTVSVKTFKLSSLVKYYFNTNTLIGDMHVYGLSFFLSTLKRFYLISQTPVRVRIQLMNILIVPRVIWKPTTRYRVIHRMTSIFLIKTFYFGAFGGWWERDKMV